MNAKQIMEAVLTNVSTLREATTASVHLASGRIL